HCFRADRRLLCRMRKKFKSSSDYTAFRKGVDIMRSIIALTLVAFTSGLSAQEPMIFEPGAKLKIEAEGDGGGEGPAWHPKFGVFSSGGDGHMHLLGLDGKSRIYKKDAGTNGLLFDTKGNLVACEHKARRVTRTDPE